MFPSHTAYSESVSDSDLGEARWRKIVILTISIESARPQQLKIKSVLFVLVRLSYSLIHLVSRALEMSNSMISRSHYLDTTDVRVTSVLMIGLDDDLEHVSAEECASAGSSTILNLSLLITVLIFFIHVFSLVLGTHKRDRNPSLGFLQLDGISGIAEIMHI
mmetsp:Transcript_16276/g.33014  ORF Transcript_16276/g.33014 Transcript_16276/m.33014 type:complete len:162 (-) Transcript_16276:328-813(-)